MNSVYACSWIVCNRQEQIPLELYWTSLYWEKEEVNQPDIIREILSTYRKHGWELRRLLLVPETRAEVLDQNESTFEGARVVESTVDALWFSRPSTGKREAWELRLIAETPYALFETFEADEAEEAREEMRQEMEARLAEFTLK